jgi:PAS domain S-box-containing protein
VAILAAAVSILLHHLLYQRLGESPMLVLTLAVLVAAYAGGAGPGLCATAIAAVAQLYLLVHHRPLGHTSPEAIAVSMFLFIVVGLTISELSEALHRSRRQHEAAAESLARANRHISEVLSSITDCYFAVDRNWRVIDANDRAADYFRHPRHQFIGPSFWDTMPQCVSSDFDRRFRHVVGRQTAPIHVESPSCCVAGNWAEYHAYPSPDGMRFYFRDISDRKRAEEALRRSEEQLRSILDNAPAVVYLKDPDGHYRFANHYLVQLVRCPLEQIVGKTDPELLPPETAEACLRNDRAVLERGQPMQFEEVVPGEDGPHTYMSVKFPLRDGDGRVYALCGISADVTARKRAEEALRLSEERLRLATESAQLGTWDYNPLTGLVTLSDRACDILQLPRQLSLDYELFLAAVHPQDRQRVHLAKQRALDPASGGEYEQEFRVLAADGSTHWAAARGRALFEPTNNGHRAVRLIGIARDITQTKHAEEDLLDAKQQAEAANQAKDHFLATLSHELRTPLTPVLVTASAMESDRRLDPQTLEDVQVIRRNADMEVRLIDDLLDLTRIARGKLELQQDVVDVHDIIAEAVSTTASDPAAASKTIPIHTHLDAPSHHAFADPHRLQQVLWNLIKNAVKFTPAGGHVTIESDNPQPDRIRIRVTDTGIGIEPDALPRIFDPFQQQGPDVTRRYGGLGLGLAISKTIVELHGGAIWAESPGRGKGATFTVELSTCSPSSKTQPPLANPPSDHAAPPQPPATPPDRPALRILLVDDHPDTVTSLAQLLTRHGYHVRTATTFTSALDLANQHQFDLIISDLGLPDGSGLDLMRRVRSTQQTVQGVALSGYGMADDLRDSREAGFAEHLVKPINIHQLEATIQRLAGQ